MWLLSLVFPLIRWARKVFLHLITGKSELERLLSARAHDGKMVAAFSRAFQRSRHLSGLKKTVFGQQPFEVDRMATSIVSEKKMKVSGAAFRDRLLPNLQACLTAINNTNLVLDEANKLRSTPYDSRNPEHEAMLERLWTALMPGVTRKHGRFTGEWGAIGFQGQDPATDFRGMGVLGLHQMLFFARQRSHVCRGIIERTELPYRGYPFAITGIQITSMVFEMLRTRRLADVFPRDREHGLLRFHELYCDIYTLFAEWWQHAEPENIMAFQAVFGAFTEKLQEYIASRGVVPPPAWVAATCTKHVSAVGRK